MTRASSAVLDQAIALSAPVAEPAQAIALPTLVRRLGPAAVVGRAGRGHAPSRWQVLAGANAALAAERRARQAAEASLRAFEERSLQSARLADLGLLSATVAHELNQPLCALKLLSANTHALLDRQETDELRANLRRIAELSDRLCRTVRQLKDHAHPSPPAAAAVDVRSLIERARCVVASQLNALGVDFQVRVQPDRLTVCSDAHRLEQVLVNLMTNAIDALRDAARRRLGIEALCLDARCIISVRDSGHGVRPDVVDRLFRPFVTSKPAGFGLGLGLAISRQIVRQLGGSLRLQASEQDGARFVIEIPAAPSKGGH